MPEPTGRNAEEWRRPGQIANLEASSRPKPRSRSSVGAFRWVRGEKGTSFTRGREEDACRALATAARSCLCLTSWLAADYSNGAFPGFTSLATAATGRWSTQLPPRT